MTPARMGESHGRTNVCRMAATAARGVGCVQSMTTPEKSSPAWLPSASRYRRGPPLNQTSGTAHAATPAAAAAIAWTRTRATTTTTHKQQGHRQNRHLRSEPDRQPGQKRAGHDPPRRKVPIFRRRQKVET